ncbi:hypothetical protein ACA910_021970 [Epithemia clementina (nom. ined.)]
MRISQIRGGQAVDDGEKWSWEKEAEKNVPLKMFLGLSIFAAKAFEPKLRRRHNRNTSISPSTHTQQALGLHQPAMIASSNVPKHAVIGSGMAEISELYINLVKAILGVGVLSLPSGIAAFGNAPSAILPAVLLVAIMGTLSSIGFSWIAQVCARTGSLSYREAWSKSVSPKTSWIPTFCALCNPFVACLSYSMVLADSINGLVPVESRTYRLWGITALAVLPLCWMKDLKSLVPFSMLGILGMVYAIFAMGFRLLSGSYRPGSKLFLAIPQSLQPSFGDKGWDAVFRPQSILFVSMLSSSFMCHINSPRFYRQLKDNSVERFNRLVKLGFGTAIMMAGLLAAIGFATFGSNCQGFVLKNYAPNDTWIGFSRLAVTTSILFSYPITFQALRDGVLETLGISVSNRTNKALNQTTILLLFSMTAMATILTDVGVVVAFSGATLGNMLAYILPAIMFWHVEPRARIPATILGSLGVILGLVGTALAMNKLSKPQ